MNQPTQTPVQPTTGQEAAPIICEIEYRCDDGRPPITRTHAVEGGDAVLNEATLIALSVAGMIRECTLNQCVTEAVIRIPSRCGKEAWNQTCPDCGRNHGAEHREHMRQMQLGGHPENYAGTPDSIRPTAEGLPPHVNQFIRGIHDGIHREYSEQAIEAAWQLISSCQGRQNREWIDQANHWRDTYYNCRPTISVHEFTPQGVKEIQMPGTTTPPTCASNACPTPAANQFITGQRVNVYDHQKGRFEGRVVRCDQSREMVNVRCCETGETEWYYYMQLDAIDTLK